MTLLKTVENSLVIISRFSSINLYFSSFRDEMWHSHGFNNFFFRLQAWSIVVKFSNDDKKLNCDLWSHQEMDQMSIATTVMEFHAWGYKISRISAYSRARNKLRGMFITFWKKLEDFFEKWPQCLKRCKRWIKIMMLKFLEGGVMFI